MLIWGDAFGNARRDSRDSSRPDSEFRLEYLLADFAARGPNEQ